MSDRTEINAIINSTEINSDIRQSTMVNPDVAATSYIISAGSIIAGNKNAKTDFEKRVKGQDFAITKPLDVIKRAITWMTGLQGSA